MNPELRRNLWLELSPHRLIAAPIVLGLLFLLVSSSQARPWPSVFSTASGILFLVVHLWGMRKAGESVTEEVRDRTWDWQRLSSLGAWPMAWGKLVGATAFPWYVGLLCLATMAVAWSMEASLRGTPWVMLGLAASAVTLQAGAFAGSILASRKDSRLGARLGTFLLFPVAIAALAAYVQVDREMATPITWYHVRFGPLRFLACSAVAFAGWALLGAHREMQRELRVRALPWGIPAFVLFMGAYVAGFEMPMTSAPSAFVFGCFFTAMVLVYYGLFADVTNAMTLRTMLQRARGRDWRRGLEALPLWAVALPIAALFSVLSALQPMPPGLGLGERWLGLYPVAMFLLALRDVGLLAFFALAPRARRVEGAALLYIVLLTVILPALFSLVGMETVARFLVPFKMGGWQATLVMTVQCAIVWGAALARGRRLARALRD